MDGLSFGINKTQPLPPPNTHVTAHPTTMPCPPFPKQLAVTIGKNILRFERGAGADHDGDEGGEEWDEEEAAAAAEEEMGGEVKEQEKGVAGLSPFRARRAGDGGWGSDLPSTLSIPVGSYAYERGARSMSMSSSSQSQIQSSGGANDGSGSGSSSGQWTPLATPASASSGAAVAPTPVRPRRRGRARSTLGPRVGGGANSVEASPLRHMQALATIYEVAFKSRGPSSAPAHTREGGAAANGGVGAVEEEEGDGDGDGAASALASLQGAMIQETLGVSPFKGPSSPSSGSSGGSGGEHEQQPPTRRHHHGGRHAHASARGVESGAGERGVVGLEDDAASAFSSGSGSGSGPGSSGSLRGLPRALRGLFGPFPRGGASEVSSLTDDQSFGSSHAPRSISGRRLFSGARWLMGGGAGVRNGAGAGSGAGVDDNAHDHVVDRSDTHSVEEWREEDEAAAEALEAAAAAAAAAAAPVAAAAEQAGPGKANASAYAASATGSGGLSPPLHAPVSAAAGGSPQATAASAAAATVGRMTDASLGSGGRSIVTESEWRAWRKE
jgi:hypothetical protein